MKLLEQTRWAVRDVLLNGVIGSYAVPRFARSRLLRIAGVPVSGAAIQARCFFGSRAVSIGSGTFVNYGCFFEGGAQITIGENCQVGMDVLFCTGTHEVGGPEKRGGSAYALPVTVGDGCWIGARATILPGVSIGTGCVIGAGALVTRDCAPHGTYVGVPARRVSDLVH